MAAAIVHLTGNRIIEKGSFWKLKILYPGQVVEARFRGQIRRSIGGEKLEDFRFKVEQFDEVTNKTEFTMFLTVQQTNQIPVPPEHWLYDVKITLPGQEAIRLMQGQVHVSPGITD